MKTKTVEPLEKIATGIAGFDKMSFGGLPKGRPTLITGTAGSAKTVMATQFLVEGIRKYDENGIFITFEETPADIRMNMRGLGWDIAAWESERKWAFVDASPEPGEEVAIGEYDFGALLARTEHAVREYQATRVSIDSLGTVFNRFRDSSTLRGDLFRITGCLKKMGVTAVITAERSSEFGDIARYGIEEFVADNVIILRNALAHERRRRTIEILKYRGCNHQKGEWPFTIMPDEGMILIPLSVVEMNQKSTMKRVTSGNRGLDRMCGGGVFQDSIILVSGATGTGKTLTANEFIHGGGLAGDRCLIFSFEESRPQLIRNSVGWGLDFEKLEKAGNLRIVSQYPERMNLEEHLVRVKRIVDEYQPRRVVIDSLTALERVMEEKGFREFVIAVSAFLKELQITGLYTAATPNLLGGPSITESHLSTVTDAIIILRYVEIFGEMRRGIAILKMRGSQHDKEIREFLVGDFGRRIGKPFRNVTGILGGNPVYAANDEVGRMEKMFAE